MFLSKSLLSKYDCVWLDKSVAVSSACLSEQNRMLTVLVVVFSKQALKVNKTEVAGELITKTATGGTPNCRKHST